MFDECLNLPNWRFTCDLPVILNNHLVTPIISTYVLQNVTVLSKSVANQLAGSMKKVNANCQVLTPPTISVF